MNCSLASSTGVRFCPNCGGQLFWEYAAESNVIYLTVGSLDQPERFEPELHVWTSSRVPWLRLEDKLPEHAEEP